MFMRKKGEIDDSRCDHKLFIPVPYFYHTTVVPFGDDVVVHTVQYPYSMVPYSR